MLVLGKKEVGSQFSDGEGQEESHREKRIREVS